MQFAALMALSKAVPCLRLQKKGMGSEQTFLTSDAPGASSTLKFLVIADHGHSEVNVSLTMPGQMHGL